MCTIGVRRGIKQQLHLGRWGVLQKAVSAHSTVFEHYPLYKLLRTSAVDRKGNALIPLSVYAVNTAALFQNAGSNSRISLHKQSRKDLGQPKRQQLRTWQFFHWELVS